MGVLEMELWGGDEGLHTIVSMCIVIEEGK